MFLYICTLEVNIFWEKRWDLGLRFNFRFVFADRVFTAFVYNTFYLLIGKIRHAGVSRHGWYALNCMGISRQVKPRARW
jgi:hypothetical protein